MDILKDGRKTIYVLPSVIAELARKDEKKRPKPLARPKEGVISHIFNQGNAGMETLLQFLVDPCEMVLKFVKHAAVRVH